MDRRIQELRRRWRASESTEDLAAYLRARHEAGELSRERLDFAAHCGSEAAWRALGGPPPANMEGPAWVRGFGRFDPALTGRLVTSLLDQLDELQVFAQLVQAMARPLDPPAPVTGPHGVRDLLAEVLASAGLTPTRGQVVARLQALDALTSFEEDVAAHPLDTADRLGVALRGAPSLFQGQSVPYADALARALREALEHALHDPPTRDAGS